MEQSGKKMEQFGKKWNKLKFEFYFYMYFKLKHLARHLL